MNNNNPFVPQGIIPPRRKTSLAFKIMVVLAVHVVVIGGMLLQGCRNIPKDQTETGNTANPPDSINGGLVNSNLVSAPIVNATNLSNSLAATSAVPVAQPASTQAVSTALPPLPITPITPAPAPAVATAPQTTEYAVEAGDTFSSVAKKQHVSLKALMAANPSVDAKKLHAGQKIVIPASSNSVEPLSVGVQSEGDVAAKSLLYVVKTGDTLGKIAKSHGTTYKKLMALNDLKTTAIQVGQKLKMPAPTAAAPAATSATPAVTAQPQPVPTPAPVTTASTLRPAPATAAN